MYETTTKLRIPKYLILQANSQGKSSVYYAENIDEAMDSIQENTINTIYVRKSPSSFYWEYFCDASKGVTSI